MAAKKKITLNRREVVSRIVRERGDMLLVTGLGSTTWDAAAAGDHPNNFYFWGGMGGAAVAGLGLALAQPDRRVIVLTGDGEILMGLGSLATIAVSAPKNLALCVIDNQHYGETGMQETHTGHGVDVAGMAAAAGFKETMTAWMKKDVEAAIPLLYETKGPVFVDIKVGTDYVPMVLPMRDGTGIRGRFREAVLGDRAFD